jgi:hypothetical protein
VGKSLGHTPERPTGVDSAIFARAARNRKLYESQLPVVEQALETAALMLGTDKSRGYCLSLAVGAAMRRLS